MNCPLAYISNMVGARAQLCGLADHGPDFTAMFGVDVGGQGAGPGDVTVTGWIFCRTLDTTTPASLCNPPPTWFRRWSGPPILPRRLPQTDRHSDQSDLRGTAVLSAGPVIKGSMQTAF